jgi:hypothetical protein
MDANDVSLYGGESLIRVAVRRLIHGRRSIGTLEVATRHVPHCHGADRRGGTAAAHLIDRSGRPLQCVVLGVQAGGQAASAVCAILSMYPL